MANGQNRIIRASIHSTIHNIEAIRSSPSLLHPYINTGNKEGSIHVFQTVHHSRSLCGYFFSQRNNFSTEAGSFFCSLNNFFAKRRGGQVFLLQSLEVKDICYSLTSCKASCSSRRLILACCKRRISSNI